MATRKPERIAIVGPVPPFRGGIAQHTLMLSRALMRHAQVRVLSFTRQYPRWLYPGATDFDPTWERSREPDCHYLLDSLDPRSWQRTVAAIVEFRADAVIVPWWSAYWTFCSAYLTRRLASHGIPSCFVCHNVAGHGAAGWSRPLVKFGLRAGSGFVVQSDQEASLLQRWMPDARIAVAPHPVYSQYPEPTNVPPRRAALELLFFGFVRPYKGLEVLIQALAQLKERDVILTVAGEFWERPERFRKLIGSLGLDGKVQLINRYVEEAEAAALFARADALVMPYLRATGSGVLGLAYRYGKPVIASSVAGLAEHVQDGATGFLVEAGSADQLAVAIGRISPSLGQSMKPAIELLAGNLTWEALAATVVQQVQCGSR